MKTIMTALNHPELNKALQAKKNIKIIHKDIIYKEGILEILEIKKEINFIIINYDLPGKISNEELIQKIKKINEKIEIIFILEKENPEKEKILKKQGIKNIFYNNKIDTNQFIEMIQEKTKKTQQELEEEIATLKKMLQEKNQTKRKINMRKKMFVKRFKMSPKR